MILTSVVRRSGVNQPLPEPDGHEETTPSSRRPWVTPKVIVSKFHHTRKHFNYNEYTGTNLIAFGPS